MRIMNNSEVGWVYGMLGAVRPEKKHSLRVTIYCDRMKELKQNRSFLIDEMV
jgi:hypothetical protein